MRISAMALGAASTIGGTILIDNPQISFGILLLIMGWNFVKLSLRGD